MSAPRKSLGQSSLQVSPLVFGGNVFGWTADEPTSFKLLDRFVDAGCNFIDTADVYTRWIPGHKGGESETIIGRWLAARPGLRERVVIATKCGMDMGEGKQGLSKKYIRQAVEDSLKRLQTDVIDLYQSHRDDEATPLEETLSAFTDLRREGKVRVIGASNYTAPRLRLALETSAKHGLDSYQCLQPHYNLVERAGFEKELEPLCLEKGLGVITYFSLASGFLTGKYRSAADAKDRARGERVKAYLNEKGLRTLKALDEVSEQVRASQAQVALAWLMARPSVTGPIASATNLDQLNDLINAVNVQLSPAMINKLDEASA